MDVVAARCLTFCFCILWILFPAIRPSRLGFWVSKIRSNEKKHQLLPSEIQQNRNMGPWHLELLSRGPLLWSNTNAHHAGKGLCQSPPKHPEIPTRKVNSSFVGVCCIFRFAVRGFSTLRVSSPIPMMNVWAFKQAASRAFTFGGISTPFCLACLHNPGRFVLLRTTHRPIFFQMSIVSI